MLSVVMVWSHSSSSENKLHHPALSQMVLIVQSANFGSFAWGRESQPLQLLIHFTYSAYDSLQQRLLFLEISI